MHQPADRIWALMAQKLNNQISADDLQELEGLLAHFPEEHYAQEIIAEYWQQQPQADTSPLKKSFEKIWAAIQTKELQQFVYPDGHAINTVPTPASGPKKWWAAIAAAASIAGLGLFMFYFLQKNETPKLAVDTPNEISTKYGSKTKLLLPDSTQVWLNSGSKLTYDNNYGKTLREVKLTGEAFFDVVKNAEKPFIIHTEKMDIRVIGTAFNVKCYPGEKKVETSLIRGSIEVTLKSRQSEKIKLRPNEKLVIADDELVQTKPAKFKNEKIQTQLPEDLISIRPISYNNADNDVVETAWVRNKLVFNQETFEELALKFERWYGVKIIFKNNRLRTNKLTGTFENETIQQALNALQYTTKFKYNLNKNEVTIF